MSPSPPWEDLPLELLSTIARFFDQNPLDIIHFRSVCKSWHSTLSFPCHFLSPLFPLSITSPSSIGVRSSSSSSCFALSVTVVYTIKPKNGVSIEGSSSFDPKTWVVFVDELNPGKVSIRRPFSRSDFDMPLDFPLRLNLLDFHVCELGRYYNVSNVQFVWGKFIKRGFWNCSFDKVVIFSNGSRVIVVYDEGKLGLLSLEDVSNDWVMIHDGKGFRFDDIVEFKGRVLGIDRRGRVYEMGYDSLKMNVIIPAISGGGGRRKRLVESLGFLYLVVKLNCRSHKMADGMSEFRVYVLNEKLRKWVQVDSIGDRIFFFGLDFSMSSYAHGFEGSLNGNCIIFFEHSFATYGSASYWRFPFSNPRFSDLPVALYQFESGASIHAIKSLPSCSHIFWPPPSWVWPNDKLKLYGTFETAFDRLLKGITDDNLKVNYQELSSLVEAIVTDDVISEQLFRNMLKHVNVLPKFLNDLVQEVEKDSKSIKRSIIDDAEARRLRCKSKDLLNQAGTSSLNVENRNGCSDASQNATHDCNEDEWLSNAISRRLGTHYRLKMLLNGISSVLTKNMDKLQACSCC